MNEQLTIGKITFNTRSESFPGCVVPRDAVRKQPDIDHHRTEIAMMKSLMVRHKEQAAKFAKELLLTTP